MGCFHGRAIGDCAVCAIEDLPMGEEGAGFVAAADIARSIQERLALAERDRDEAIRKRIAMSSELTEALTEVESVHAKLRIVQAPRENVWMWEDGGENDPKSLSCPVVMSAKTLRGMLGDVERAEVKAIEETAKRLAGEVATSALIRAIKGTLVAARVDAFAEVAEVLRGQKGGEWALFGHQFLADRIAELAKEPSP